MKNLPKYIDIAFCLLVLPAMLFMFPVERWYHNFQTYMVSMVAWLYCLYFINRTLTVPCLFKSKKMRLAGIGIIVASLFVTYCFSAISLFNPPPHKFHDGYTRLLPMVKPYQQAVWSLFMIVEAFSFAVGLFTQTEVQRTRRREVEAQRDRAEIDLYRAQIKPHFMFNTLNSLYGLFLTGNANALPSLEKFISMMRYIHTTASHTESVSLSEEADYIQQYVELQSLRLNDKTKVALNIDIADKSLRVPPMLLVTFVENCFKHGVSPVEESTITISLTERDGVLEFRTCNRMFPNRRVGEHLGIENCRKRLNLSYPDSHRLTISDADRLFGVELIINLTK
ncbi:MAG: sensor histidine kinase [Muribaculaceae bacterium]|nr:sensor histidine kinase [Muribaculaceae bacterium]